MTEERILSLDISSKTGWAVGVVEDGNLELEACGVLPQIHEPKDESYPGSFVTWAYQCFEGIVELVDRYHPTILAIEETTANSKSSHSQKILEYLHFLTAKMIKETGIKNIFLPTGQWRRIVDCKMTKAESEHNKAVKKYKEEHNDTRVAYDDNGKRIGKIGKKHVAIRRANEVFGKFLDKPLIRKDEDKADALMILYACFLKQKAKEVEA